MKKCVITLVAVLQACGVPNVSSQKRKAQAKEDDAHIAKSASLTATQLIDVMSNSRLLPSLMRNPLATADADAGKLLVSTPIFCLGEVIESDFLTQSGDALSLEYKSTLERCQISTQTAGSLTPIFGALVSPSVGSEFVTRAKATIESNISCPASDFSGLDGRRLAEVRNDSGLRAKLAAAYCPGLGLGEEMTFGWSYQVELAGTGVTRKSTGALADRDGKNCAFHVVGNSDDESVTFTECNSNERELVTQDATQMTLEVSARLEGAVFAKTGKFPSQGKATVVVADWSGTSTFTQADATTIEFSMSNGNETQKVYMDLEGKFHADGRSSPMPSSTPLPSPSNSPDPSTPPTQKATCTLTVSESMPFVGDRIEIAAAITGDARQVSIQGTSVPVSDSKLNYQVTASGSQKVSATVSNELGDSTCDAWLTAIEL